MTTEPDDLGLPPRFWAKVNKNGPEVRPGLGPCWLWTGAKTEKGYGTFLATLGSKTKSLSHRVSLAAALKRPISKGLSALHKCDVHLCVNPSHLWEGRQAENIADMIAKDRQAKGEEHSQAKLTVEQVLAIRADDRIHRVIAADYGVSRAAVTAIKGNKRWAHLSAQSPCAHRDCADKIS